MHATLLQGIAPKNVKKRVHRTPPYTVWSATRSTRIVVACLPTVKSVSVQVAHIILVLVRQVEAL